MLATRNGKFLRMAIGDESFRVVSSNDTIRRKAPERLTSDSWHHICFVNKGDSTQIWIDNNKNTIKRLKINESAKLLINGKFLGFTEDLRFYNFALDKAQIEAVYNGGQFTLDEKLKANGVEFSPIRHFKRQ